MRVASVGFFAVLAFGLLATHSVNAKEIVPFAGYSPGTVVVKTNERHLYYILKDNEAIRYPVGVGRAGKRWSGKAFIAGKFLKPGWSPPEEIKRDKPSLPDVIPSGSPHNPMGAAALTLNVGQYAIHGTNDPGSIGRFVSYGCIRMYNKDILDLYERVSTGTEVVVLK